MKSFKAPEFVFLKSIKILAFQYIWHFSILIFITIKINTTIHLCLWYFISSRSCLECQRRSLDLCQQDSYKKQQKNICCNWILDFLSLKPFTAKCRGAHGPNSKHKVFSRQVTWVIDVLDDIILRWFSEIKCHLLLFNFPCFLLQENTEKNMLVLKGSSFEACYFPPSLKR